MSVKVLAAKAFAQVVDKKVQKWAQNPIKTQEKVFKKLLKTAENTDFGKDHNFKNINSHSDFIAVSYTHLTLPTIYSV